MFIARSVEFPHDQPASLLSLSHDPLLDLAYGLIPWSIGASVLRYRLWDIDVIISRTLIYGALTASVVGLYVLIVGYIGAALRVGNTPAISIVGAGAVAVVFQPLREFLQRGVNRLMYGERDDPYAVLSNLGKRLETTLTPEVALPTIVEAVAHALRLPYVAITLWQGDSRAVVAEHGSSIGNALALPLTYGHEAVGDFILGLRAGDSKFSPADQRLLADLARQVSVVAYAVRLTSDLRHSRERLVSTREEERLRLRRDLHDGLGPTLASLVQRLDVIGALIPGDPAAALSLISEVKVQARTTITDIRRLVYALRPPALDEYGLSGALREMAAKCEEINGLSIVFSAPDELPALPAAVEVAAYYIATEALNNVVRHAQAQTCSIRLGIGDALAVEVIDDGCGLPADYRFGIGMMSMRERATELGGICHIEPNGARGVRVDARLPIAGRTRGRPPAYRGSRMMDRIRLLVADDHRFYREGVRTMLGAMPDVELVGEAGTGEEAIALAAELQPDVVLMDIKMPGIDGIEATRRTVRTSPHVGVLIVTCMTTMILSLLPCGLGRVAICSRTHR